MSFETYKAGYHDLRCKYCGSQDVVRAGGRIVKAGKKQLYKCGECLRRFSNTNRSGKHTDARIVLEALTLYCQKRLVERLVASPREVIRRVTLTKNIIFKKALKTCF